MSGKAGGVSGGGTEKDLEPMPPHALRDAFGESLLLADVIVADTAKHAVHPSGRWQRSPAYSALDAALPQAFVHALMLECAARLGSPWKRE